MHRLDPVGLSALQDDMRSQKPGMIFYLTLTWTASLSTRTV